MSSIGLSIKYWGKVWGMLGGHIIGFHFGKANNVAASAVSVVRSNPGLAEGVGTTAVELN